ncbi:hypothetical protein ACHHYP_02501 [Achlya hypogyna]|uniref:Protein cereblon n=1 Tax=Achlya hypogyna TaxID=1202772 RepID=A0A1V9Z654_ACHHY|nr:hypothetical protein ACHHYP_02501 [Achlya hypogyna]
MSTSDDDEFLSARSDDSSDDGIDALDATDPGDHAYLGEDVGVERPSTAYVNPGSVIELPLVVLPQIVIFPGETLPLRMLSSATIQLITLRTRLRQQFDTFVVINTLSPPVGHVGTIVQIERIYEQHEVHLSIVGRGCQRVRLESVSRGRNAILETPYATVQVLPDHHALPAPFPWKRRSFGHWRTAEYNLFDGRALVRKAQTILSTSADWHHFAGTASSLLEAATSPPPEDPTQYSYWLSAHVHMILPERQALLSVNCTVRRLRLLIAWLQEHTSSIQCAGCHAILGATADIFSTAAGAAGVGTFVNPGGHVHQILTMHSVKMEHVHFEGRPTSRDTWFPGYTWQCMYCTPCGAFIGWRYASRRLTPHVFYGLVRAAIQ